MTEIDERSALSIYNDVIMSQLVNKDLQLVKIGCQHLMPKISSKKSWQDLTEDLYRYHNIEDQTDSKILSSWFELLE